MSNVQKFPIPNSVLSQCTDRNASDILRLYAHHSDETDNHSGPWAPLAEEIKSDLVYLRNIQAGQKVSIGALCLAYNYVIMEDGIVWECRPALIVPASQLGDNLHGLSVCFDGNFMEHGVNPQQLASGLQLFRQLAQTYTVKEIWGHCDVAKYLFANNDPGYYATSCPGTYFYTNQLPVIRQYALKA